MPSAPAPATASGSAGSLPIGAWTIGASMARRSHSLVRMPEPAYAVSVDGAPVAELESFAPEDVEAARGAGATLLWVHSNEDLSAHGFRRVGAYVRMHAAEVPVRGREPSFIEERDYAEVLEAYEDVGFDSVERVQGWELRL